MSMYNTFCSVYCNIPVFYNYDDTVYFLFYVQMLTPQTTPLDDISPTTPSQVNCYYAGLSNACLNNFGAFKKINLMQIYVYNCVSIMHCTCPSKLSLVDKLCVLL